MNVAALSLEPQLAPAAPSGVELKDGAIMLWIWDLRADPGQLERMREVLCRDELARASRLKFGCDQRRFMSARAGLRQILGMLLQDAPEALSFDVTRLGKPLLHCDDGPAPLRFNLSHSGEKALLALCNGKDLGVDLEIPRADKDLMKMAEFVFNAREKRWLFSLPVEERTGAFFRIWTLKEALIKARGESLSSAMDLFSVLPGEGNLAHVLHPGTGDALPSWRASNLDVCPGFQAALAWEQGASETITIESPRVFEYPY